MSKESERSAARGFIFTMGTCWYVLARAWAPEGAAWDWGFAGLGVTWIGAGGYWFLWGSKARRAEVAAERARALRRARIRELEEELGYEPMELAVDDAPELWTK